MPFAGELILDEDSPSLRAEIDFTKSDLVISTAAGPIGEWPLENCRVQHDNGRFLISIAGEKAWFVPDDAPTFTHEVLSRWTSPTLASAVNAVRAASAPARAQADSASPSVSEPDSASEGGASKRLSPTRVAQLGMVMIVGSVVIFFTIMLGGGGGGGSPTGTLDTLPPSTTTTIVPVVFMGGLREVAVLWNEASETLGVDLFLPAIETGHRMQVALPDGLVLYGTEDPETRIVRTLMVSAGPGQGNHGRVVLAAWGVLISVANPELNPAERRELLEQLGVDVDQPLTIGLDTEAVQGGARYWLIVGVLGGRALLGVHSEIAPAS